jgi:hypothetical protein
MHTNKIYTGIGSRETPPEILKLMRNIGGTLGKNGWTLRSGHAPGADQAFEEGARAVNVPQLQLQLFIPWRTFENATRGIEFIVPDEVLPNYEEAQHIASQFHPAWEKCTDGARKLHTRNVYQIAGKDLNTKTNFVVCWTLDGKRGGGTGQTLRLASYLEIPIFDLAICKPSDILEYVNYGVIPS